MKILAIYDNGGKTWDQYTVYFDQKETEKEYYCLGMSAHPFHPLGFCQHSRGMLGRHNGKKIELKDLPIDCQVAVYKELLPLKVKPLKKLKRKYSWWRKGFAGKVYPVYKLDTLDFNLLFVAETGPNKEDYQLVYLDECQILD